MNEKGDLIDDGNTSKVFDSTGKEVYSGSTGRQGSLEAWLSLDNAFTSLLKPAGYEYDGKQWSKNPGKIDHTVIEKAHNEGLLTDDQVFNLLRICQELTRKFELVIKEDNNIIEQKNDILSDEQKKHTSIEIMSEIKKLQEEMNAFGEISESQFNMFMTLAKNFNLAIIEEGNLYVNSYVKNGVITTNFEATQDSIGNYKVNYHHGIDIVGGDLISPFFLIGVGEIEKGANDKIFSVIGTDLRMRVLHGDSDSVIKSGDFFTPGDIIMPFPKNNNFNIASTGPHFHIDLSNGKNFVNPYTLKQSSKIFKTTTDGGKTWSKTNFGY